MCKTNPFQKILMVMAVTGALMIGCFGFAGAADESAADESFDDYMLEEVTVTATKREMKIQDVPQSISALTGTFLDELGYDDLEDFALAVPGLEVTSGGPGNKKIVIRGINSFAGAALVSQYLNEIPITGDSATNFDVRTYDLERVEFLKGPQGTLYGEGSMGGTVRMITRKPNMGAFEASGRLSVNTVEHGDDIGYDLDGMLNIPVVRDVFGLRFVGSYRDIPGFLDNDVTGKEDENTNELLSGRFTAQLNPMDALTITGIAYLGEQDVEGYFAARPSSLTYSADPNNAKDIESQIYDLTVQYDLGWAELVSATGYSNQDMNTLNDLRAFVAFGNAVFSDLITFGLMPPVEQVFEDYIADVTVFSQEVRLVSSAENRLKWTLGGFYREKEIEIFNQINSIPFVDFGAILGGAIFPPGTQIQQFSRTDKFEQMAVFGELEYALLDTISVIVGGRYFKEEVTFRDNSFGLLLGAPNADPSPQNSDDDFSKFVPKFAIAYQPSKDLMVYATASEGFRSGLINTDNMLQISGMTEGGLGVDPEAMWNYELGLKSTFRDGALIFNAAAYYMDWSERQVIQQTLIPSG
ncbi:MAG: TonB-dependent receptor, partial [Deltaproteobacteria bacterium]|nr:TonB-dependent receptor [Deltaproteobacteria bacterium]